VKLNVEEMFAMQPINQLAQQLERLAGSEHCLFMLSDLRAVLPEHSQTAFKTLVSRAEKKRLLKRVCRGVYLYPKVDYARGLVLFHTVARLRAGDFNYLSLESVLSDAGVISQIPMNWITVMSSGRTNTISCGDFGTIEFVHTQRRPARIYSKLIYDFRCRMWRASVKLAIKDMKITQRNMDLIAWDAVHELV